MTFKVYQFCLISSTLFLAICKIDFITTSNQALAASSHSKRNSASEQELELLKQANTSFQLSQAEDILPDEDEEFLEELDPEEVIPEELEPLEPEETEPEINLEEQKQFILDALSQSADQYPFITNPSDGLTISEEFFAPNEKSTYSDFDIRFAEDNPLLKKFSAGLFPPDNQFYWIVDGNRVVFETKGTQLGMNYQGRTDEIEVNQEFLLSQSFLGIQAIFGLPSELSSVEGEQENLDEFSVVALALQAGQSGDSEDLNLPENIDLNINIGNRDDSQQDVDSISELGTGFSNRIEDGSSLFENVDTANAPRIIQAFPTVDLSPLVAGENVPLERGANIPEESLQQLGLDFASPIDDNPQLPQFQQGFSSEPGIKIGQRQTFDNLDLLNVLVNPSLSESERNERYLNSLFWAYLGQEEPQVFREETRENFDWHRVYASYAHNRSMIEYDKDDIAATYTNVFSNPGVSLTLSWEEAEIDDLQSANATLGMLLGFPLRAVSGINDLQSSLDEGKKEFEAKEQVTPLQDTAATSDQRQQINERLNQTLRYSQITSELKQVSGTITFPSQITPDGSNILQLRTGLHERSVQFQEQFTNTTQGQPFFSELRLSKENFNLNFLGIPIVEDEPRNDIDNNTSGIAEIALISPEGQQFIEQLSSEAPLPSDSFALAFDRIEISRIDERNTQFNQFLGSLQLPSVELLWAGSSKDFNYGVSAGGWFNINPDSAPGVETNRLGPEEPSVGAYLSSVLNVTSTNLIQNEQGNPIGFDAHIPTLRVSWNSAINERNPFSATLSYTYFNQRQNRSFTISPLIAYIPNGGEEEVNNTDVFGVLQGELNFNTGLTLNASLEARDEFFYNVEGLQDIDSNVAIGGFVSNFTRTLQGLRGRRSGFRWGPVVKVKNNDDDTVLESRLGLGEGGVELRLEGNISF